MGSPPLPSLANLFIHGGSRDFRVRMLVTHHMVVKRKWPVRDLLTLKGQTEYIPKSSQLHAFKDQIHHGNRKELIITFPESTSVQEKRQQTVPHHLQEATLN